MQHNACWLVCAIDPPCRPGSVGPRRPLTTLAPTPKHETRCTCSSRPFGSSAAATPRAPRSQKPQFATSTRHPRLARCSCFAIGSRGRSTFLIARFGDHALQHEHARVDREEYALTQLQSGGGGGHAGGYHATIVGIEWRRGAATTAANARATRHGGQTRGGD